VCVGEDDVYISGLGALFLVDMRKVDKVRFFDFFIFLVRFGDIVCEFI